MSKNSGQGIEEALKKGRMCIIVKPGSGKTEITGYDPEKKAYRINLKAQPEKGQANKELVKFLSKITKEQVRITSGLTSKTKHVETIKRKK